MFQLLIHMQFFFEIFRCQIFPDTSLQADLIDYILQTSARTGNITGHLVAFIRCHNTPAEKKYVSLPLMHF